MRFLKPRIGRKLEGVKPPARAAFPVDDRLIERQLAAAKQRPVNDIKRLIEEQPDTFVKPKPYYEVPF